MSLSYDFLEHSSDIISALHIRSVNMVKLVTKPSQYCRLWTIKLSGFCKTLLTNLSMSLFDLCLVVNSQPSIACLNSWLIELSTFSFIGSWLSSQRPSLSPPDSKISQIAAHRHQLWQQIAFSYTSGSKSPTAIFHLGEIIDSCISPDTNRHLLYSICFASPRPEKPQLVNS